MLTRPYDFQVIGVRRIKRFGGRALLADDMGLGKSLQFLLHLHRHPHLRPAVVVCPAGLKYNWENEAFKHLGMRAQVLETTRPPKRLPRVAPPLYIVGYNVLGQRGGEHAGPGWGDWLRSLNPQVIGLDECQAISNRTALRTRWVRHLCKGVPHVVGMSGTPLTNRPAELFSVLNILRPDLFPAFRPYADEFCDPKVKPWGVDYSGAKNLDKLHQILTDNLMIRRRKSDVLRELPAKRRSVVPLPLSDEREYRHAVRDFLTWLAVRSPERVFRASRAERLTQVGYLRRLIGRLKLPAVFDWVDGFLQGSEGKLILFAIHAEVMDALFARYKKLAVRVDGSVVAKDRQRAADAFQSNNRVRLFLGNVDAAGKGLTLTASSSVAFAELPWTPGAVVQAEDRPHRIGQTDTVDVSFLIARGTIEQRVVKVVQDKAATLAAVLDGGPSPEDLDVFDLLCSEMTRERVS